MATLLHAHEDFENFTKTVGHPNDPLPRSIREAYAAAGMTPPLSRGMLSVITPPTPLANGQSRLDPSFDAPCYCHVCGKPTELQQNLRAHAVAAFEDVSHPRTGDLLRILVTHCDSCVRSEHCDPNSITPGSGYDDHYARTGELRPGGYCEAIPKELMLGAALFPGAHMVGRLLTWGIGAAGLLVASMLALQHSQGQAYATLQGTANQAVCVQDSTANHGYNAGQIRILTGSAPALANTAESGTLLINWAIPATAFGAASGTVPNALCTMGAVSNVSASATGTAGYGRMTTGASGTGFPTLEDGTLSTTQRRIQFAVATSGSDMNFNTLNIVSAGTCSMTSLTYGHPA